LMMGYEFSRCLHKSSDFEETRELTPLINQYCY
jgi:hypothetical protein